MSIPLRRLRRVAQPLSELRGNDAVEHAQAIILGPASWRVVGLLVFTGGAGDKMAHGGTDLLPWFLEAVKAHDQVAGHRTLDVLDVHYYPTGVSLDQADDTSAATRALRLRQTRSFWDWTYQDEGWIGSNQWVTQTQPSPNCVALIPRWQESSTPATPGTRLGVTEWSMAAKAT